MSGKDKAVDFGIYRRSDVKKLMQYKTIFRIIRQYNRFVASLVGILFVFIPYMINESVTSTLVFGTPNSVFIGLLLCMQILEVKAQRIEHRIKVHSE